MSTTTEMLNLFKYDTKADKKKKFNINQGLNKNWDKIDNFAKKVEFKSNSFVPGTIYQVTGKIDESENLFRYANGQIVIEDDSIKGLTAFLDKQEKLGNTSIFCTEEEWQAEKTLSKFGQCGKYVRDKEAGTLRLPAIVNLQGVMDLTNVGVTKAESLPAHMHSRGTQEIIGQIMGGNAVGSSGAFTEAWRQNCRVNFNGTDVSDMSLYNFNASKTWTGKTSNPDNSTYQNNMPVQQEAIQYPYVLCVNSGTAEEPERPINNYMVNNPFSFGVSQYYKGEMNNLSWLRSNGQKNYKAVYPDFYNWALGQLNAGVEGFKNHTDENITDYDFVINQADESFILPLKNGSENLPSDKYENLTLLQNGSSYTAPANGYYTLSKKGDNGTYIQYTSSYKGDRVYSCTTNSDIYLSSKLLKEGDTITWNYTANGNVNFFRFVYAQGNGNLYYYVGDTLENADLVNIARLQEGLVDKVDINSSWGFPSNKFVDLTLGASGSSYTAPAKGWFVLSIRSLNNNAAEVHLSCGSLGMQSNCYGATDAECKCFVPAKKGDIARIYYANVQATPEVWGFIYAEGEQ